MLFLCSVLIHFVILSNSEALPDIIKIGKAAKHLLKSAKTSVKVSGRTTNVCLMQEDCSTLLTTLSRTPVRAARKLPSGDF